MSRHTIIKISSAIVLLLVLVMAIVIGLSSPPEDASPNDENITEATTRSAPAPAEVTALRGIITDQDGDPIEGVTIALSEDTSVDTDALGAFAFEAIPDGADSLTITPPEGFMLPEHLTSIPLPDTLSDPLDLTLHEAATLQGTLLAKNELLKDASISILYLEARGPQGLVEPFTLDAMARTPSSGEFSLTLMPGRMQLLVETKDYPFYQSAPLTLDAASNTEDLEIDISPTDKLSIALVNETGELINGNLILFDETTREIILRTPSSTAAPVLVMTSFDQEKPFVILGSARGYKSGRTTITPGPSASMKATLTLEPAAQNFSGVVLGPDYEPVPDATVVLTAPGTRQKIARTDKEGRFSLDGPPNINSMQAQVISARHPPSDELSLTRGEEHMFLLARGGFIAGQVISARGVPVTDYLLEVVDYRPESGPRYNRLADFGKPDISHPQGAFTFGPLRPGTYYLKASPVDLASAESDPVSVSTARTTSGITITVQQPGRVIGLVTDAQSGDPLAQATVALTSTNRATISTKTDETGRYTLEDVPPGRQSVRVTMTSYTTQFSAGVEVAPGGTTTQDIWMEKGDAKKGFSFFGIGATLEKNDEGLRMRQVMEGSPAKQAGARDGDMILSIDGKSTDNMRVIDAVELIRGQEDTDVQLDIDRPGEGRLTLTVTRGKVEAKR